MGYLIHWPALLVYKMIVTHETVKGSRVAHLILFFFLVVGITRVQPSWACELSLLVVWSPGFLKFNSHESFCEFLFCVLFTRGYMCNDEKYLLCIRSMYSPISHDVSLTSMEYNFM